MRLYLTPGACSISPHIVLEEIGEPFETRHVAIMQGESRSDAFLSINPKGKIPVLVLDDGNVVTENPVILQLLARLYPDHRLLPADRAGEFDALQLCEYLTGTVHTLGLGRLFRPGMFDPDPDHADDVRAEGARIIAKGFDLVAPRLLERPYLCEAFSIADASLFYFELHANRLGIEMPAAVRLHFERMLERPAVVRVLAKEGLDRADFRLA